MRKNASTSTPPVQVADDPVERGRLDALDDVHVLARDVQDLLGDLCPPPE